MNAVMRVLILCYSFSCLSASTTPTGSEHWGDIDSFIGDLYANKLEPLYFLSWVITTREILQAFVQSTSLDNFQRKLPRRRASGGSAVSTPSSVSGSPSTPRVIIRPPLTEIRRAVTNHKNWLDKRVESCLTTVEETSELLNSEIFECIYAQSPPPSASQSPSIPAAAGSPRSDVSPMMLPPTDHVAPDYALSAFVMDRIKLGFSSARNEAFENIVDPIGPVIDLESAS